MKKICLLQLFFLIIFCPVCKAQSAITEIMISSYIDIFDNSAHVDEWTDLCEQADVLFYMQDNETIMPGNEKIATKTNDGFCSHVWENKCFTFSEAEEMFDCSEYLNAINSKITKNTEIESIIYNKPYQAVVLTDCGIYVLTGNGDIWDNTAEEIEVLTIKEWQQTYSKPLDVTAYINEIPVDGAYLENNTVYLPIRKILEQIGLTVEWQADTNEIHIENSYIILKTDYKNNLLCGEKENRRLQLSDWTVGTPFRTTNDRIYIVDKCMSYLLKNFEYALSINIPKREVYIYAY